MFQPGFNICNWFWLGDRVKAEKKKEDGIQKGKLGDIQGGTQGGFENLGEENEGGGNQHGIDQLLEVLGQDEQMANEYEDKMKPLRRLITSLCPVTCGNLYHQLDYVVDLDDNDKDDDETDDINNLNYDGSIITNNEKPHREIIDGTLSKKEGDDIKNDTSYKSLVRAKRASPFEFDWSKISSKTFKSGLYCVQDKCWRYHPSGPYNKIDFWYRMLTGSCDLSKLNYYFYKVVDWKTLKSLG